MTDRVADQLADLADADQEDAALRDMTGHITRHYTALVEAGMPVDAAVMLCRDFQAALVSPVDAHMVVSMEGFE